MLHNGNSLWPFPCVQPGGARILDLWKSQGPILLLSVVWWVAVLKQASPRTLAAVLTVRCSHSDRGWLDPVCLQVVPSSEATQLVGERHLAAFQVQSIWESSSWVSVCDSLALLWLLAPPWSIMFQTGNQHLKANLPFSHLCRIPQRGLPMGGIPGQASVQMRFLKTYDLWSCSWKRESLPLVLRAEALTDKMIWGLGFVSE